MEKATKSPRRVCSQETLEIKKGEEKEKTQSQSCLDLGHSQNKWRQDSRLLHNTLRIKNAHITKTCLDREPLMHKTLGKNDLFRFKIGIPNTVKPRSPLRLSGNQVLMLIQLKHHRKKRGKPIVTHTGFVVEK